MRCFLIPLLLACLTGCQTKPEAEPPPTKLTASEGTPPDTILIASPYGAVTFTHAKHFERVNGDCTVCHPKVFPQALDPLNYRKAQHRAAEATMTSCAHCHAVGGTSFAADSNCTKCHAPKEH
ncbi:MAG TPA: c(7)-type cytochrome triheme domain-containing protein [Bryobacteraceae bacterium]|jgi:c(7)-type cytochrome triheme protein